MKFHLLMCLIFGVVLCSCALEEEEEADLEASRANFSQMSCASLRNKIEQVTSACEGEVGGAFAALIGPGCVRTVRDIDPSDCSGLGAAVQDAVEECSDVYDKLASLPFINGECKDELANFLD